MDRREAIRLTTVLMGTTLSASTIATLLNGCTVDTRKVGSLFFLHHKTPVS